MSALKVEDKNKSGLVLQLYQKQQKMDEEFIKLRENMFETLEKFRDELKDSSQRSAIEELIRRMDTAEDEIKETKRAIKVISDSMTIMTQNVESIHTNVVDIKMKQSAENNLLYKSQDQFIGQLWKAFFAILGILTTVGAGIVGLLQFLH